MEIIFTLGEKEKTEIRLERNQFTGKFTYMENGLVKVLRSSTDNATHFPTGNIAFYQFTIGVNERFCIRVIHTWPERFPAFRPQTYEILVDGIVFKTITSY